MGDIQSMKEEAEKQNCGRDTERRNHLRSHWILISMYIDFGKYVMSTTREGDKE